MNNTPIEHTSNDFFVEGYIDYCKRVGNTPPSTYRLCKFLFTKEVDFTVHFDSLKSLQSFIWSNLLTTTFNRLNTSKEYEDYGARERLLAFYFTLFEELKPKHALIKTSFINFKWMLFTNFQLDELKKAFQPYVNELIKLAKENEEISNRPVIENYYENLFWIHLVFLLNFWGNDTDEDFSNTDAAIEKSTHLLFDLLGRNAGDAAVDFGKFVITNGFKQ